MRYLISLAVLAAASIAAAEPPYKGMSYVAFRAEILGSSDSDESLAAVAKTGVNTVALNVWWYQDTVTSTHIAPTADSPTMESIEHAIDRAHALKIKVMLKPNVDVSAGQWRAEINPPDADAWFDSYGQFMDKFADLAQRKGVAMLCIGCEMNRMEDPKHNQRWEALIRGLRSRYRGLLTYAANWGPLDGVGGYQTLPWWDKLDYIGIDAYFPLTDKVDPQPQELVTAWNELADRIEAWRQKRGLKQPVLLAEVGYRSIDGACREPWEYKGQAKPDYQEQADAYQALFTALWDRPWCEGIFWWSWDPVLRRGGWAAVGYTPYGKPAEKVLARYYGGSASASREVD